MSRRLLPCPLCVAEPLDEEIGPHTTKALHSALHSLPMPLPNRPPPSNFLSGVARAQRSFLDPNARQKNLAKVPPGAVESSDGQWSMSYLKRKILTHMESRKEIIKITRGKFERLSSIEPLPQPDTTSKMTPGGGGGGGAVAKAAAAAAAKHNEEHVWVLGDEWRELVRAKTPIRALEGELKQQQEL